MQAMAEKLSTSLRDWRTFPQPAAGNIGLVVWLYRFLLSSKKRIGWGALLQLLANFCAKSQFANLVFHSILDCPEANQHLQPRYRRQTVLYYTLHHIKLKWSPRSL